MTLYENISFGKTRSEKFINGLLVKNIKKLDSQDIMDVYALFSYLVIRERRRYSESNSYEYFSSTIDKCRSELKERKVFEEMLSLLDLKTSFDVARFGKKLAHIEFSDF